MDTALQIKNGVLILPDRELCLGRVGGGAPHDAGGKRVGASR
jgi:hypothetical protein